MITDYFETFAILDKTTISDGMGGFVVDYIEGAEFMAGINLDTSMEARIAEKQGVTATYTVLALENVKLNYGDILKRKSNGKYYRITSDATEKKLPKNASIGLIKATAELWTKPEI